MVAGYGIFGDTGGSGGCDFDNFASFEAPSDPRFSKYESGRSGCKKKKTIATSGACGACGACPKCGSTFLTLSQREGVTLCITDAATEPSVDSLLMEEGPAEPQQTHFTKSRCVPCGTEWVAIDMEFLATDVEPLPTGLSDDGMLVLRARNGLTSFVEYDDDVEEELHVDRGVDRHTYILNAIVYLPANNVEGTITKVEKEDTNVHVDMDASDTEPAVGTKKKATLTSCFGCAMC